MRREYFLISVFIMLTLGSSVKAQVKEHVCGGIYLSYNDFVKQKLSITGKCSLFKKCIVLDDFFLHPHIIVNTEKGKTTINKDSIYAAKDCEGNTYRIYNRQHFKIVDTSGIWVYQHHYHQSEIIRNSARDMHFNNKPVYDYYYSDNGSSELRPYNQRNVN